ALAAWSFACSVFFGVLPLALWMHGPAAGAAAAVMLFVAGGGGPFRPPAPPAPPIAPAGAPPPAPSPLSPPALPPARSHRPDWALASIATLGGGALMAYVIQARVSAAEAEWAMREAAIAANLQHTLARLVFDCGAPAAALVDAEGRVVAISKDMRQGLRLS